MGRKEPVDQPLKEEEDSQKEEEEKEKKEGGKETIVNADESEGSQKEKDVRKAPIPEHGKPQHIPLFSKNELIMLLSFFVAVLAVFLTGIKYLEPNLDWKDLFYEAKNVIKSKAANPGPEPGVSIASPTVLPPTPVSFTVHFNGDGLSAGISVNSSDYTSLDTVIEKTCKGLLEETDNKGIESFQCLPSNGARLFTQTGVRVYSFLDVKPFSRTYIVPQGILFVYPLGKVGSEIYPETVETVVPGNPIKLVQLSMSPRVFTVENFMSKEEMEKVIEHNEQLVKPSEVGFSGWRDPTRTSYTAWDFSSWAAKKIQRRSFDLLGMSYDKTMADAVQVLRYNNSEWYKPHCDWFDEKGYEGHDPTVNNGTNRFATVFLYLSDVEEGGETVFPLSTTHDGYNGEQLVHKGTERTAGYISDADAQWVCNSSSTALRAKPRAGSAVLFYSQGPRGELDKLSLHGGCPVIAGLKWSANVWLWNRPKPSKDSARPEDKKKAEKYRNGKEVDNGSITVTMKNPRNEPIDVYWDDGSDEMVHQFEIRAGEAGPMNTYEGHLFVAKAKSGTVVGKYRGNPSDDQKFVTFQ